MPDKSVSWAVRTTKRKSLPQARPKKRRRLSLPDQKTLTQIRFVPTTNGRDDLEPIAPVNDHEEPKRQKTLTQIQFLPRSSMLSEDALTEIGQPGIADVKETSRGVRPRRNQKKQKNTITQMDYLELKRRRVDDAEMDMIVEPEAGPSKRLKTLNTTTKTETGHEARSATTQKQPVSTRRRQTRSTDQTAPALVEKENRPPSPQTIPETPKKKRVIPSSQSPDSIFVGSNRTVFYTPRGPCTPLREHGNHSGIQTPRPSASTPSSRKVCVLKDSRDVSKSRSEWEIPETSQIDLPGVVPSSEPEENEMEVLQESHSSEEVIQSLARVSQTSLEGDVQMPDGQTYQPRDGSQTLCPPTEMVNEAPEPPQLRRTTTVPDSEDEGEEILTSLATPRPSRSKPDNQISPSAPCSPTSNHPVTLVPSSPPTAAISSLPDETTASILQQSRSSLYFPTQSIRPAPLARPSQVSTQAPTQMSWLPPSTLQQPGAFRPPDRPLQSFQDPNVNSPLVVPSSTTPPPTRNQVVIKSSPHSSPTHMPPPRSISRYPTLPVPFPFPSSMPSLDEDLDPKSPSPRHPRQCQNQAQLHFHVQAQAQDQDQEQHHPQDPFNSIPSLEESSFSPPPLFSRTNPPTASNPAQSPGSGSPAGSSAAEPRQHGLPRLRLSESLLESLPGPPGYLRPGGMEEWKKL